MLLVWQSSLTSNYLCNTVRKLCMSVSWKSAYLRLCAQSFKFKLPHLHDRHIVRNSKYEYYMIMRNGLWGFQPVRTRPNPLRYECYFLLMSCLRTTKVTPAFTEFQVFCRQNNSLCFKNNMTIEVHVTAKNLN